MILNKKIVFLSFLFAVSVGYLITAINIGAPISDGGLTPSFFPILLGGASVSFSSILLYKEFIASGLIVADEKKESRAHFWVILAIFTYIFAFKMLGYFISSAFFVFAVIIIFSSWEKYIHKAAISVTIVVLGYAMFEQLFGVRLPALWG
ncbi:tripartite tricarboxylate transporter TctB family protein [Cohaesibacter celericrescens]|uniref:tripartite tricarboxylate transporter TctB family protein n=1 Tax=Cohaesibacter celericrescens TaxID=2067669 RepID=UPI003566DDCE